MKITRIEAVPLKIPVNCGDLGVDHPGFNSITHVEVETDTGLIGYGMTSITQARPVAEVVNSVLGPEIVGLNALFHEEVWNRMYWKATPWGQTGYASHAISAIDLALWDIKGKASNQPVWQLLGGARSSLPIYATCGFSFLDDKELVDVVKRVVSQGFKGVKLQVGRPGLGGENILALNELIKSDIKRVRDIRNAVGPEIEIAVDAACRLDLPSARKLCQALEELDIAFFEEPIVQNDVRLMAELRRETTIPITAGQNEGLAYRFRDMLLADAVDVIQPNAIITGGMTQCVRIAGLASAFNVPISNGGGAPLHNAHLQAGLTVGTAVEYQFNTVAAGDALYDQKPIQTNGMMEMSNEPGFGLAPNSDVLKSTIDSA
ncbi:MAG: mandelate racemase/muconate lactonizing enzyme family protein [Alphaproteobacteria bacterium]|nr:mandelate racemase/muconate lactonizing enzyme family protein [Alphaproteobacteria bacterium]